MLKCEDCGHPYSEFGLDTTVSNYQWSLIHPESSNGILCAKCMVQRASRLPGIIVARMVFEFAPHEAVEHTLAGGRLQFTRLMDGTPIEEIAPGVYREKPAAAKA